MKAEEVASYKFNHAVPIQIRYNDIDLSGHVNNGVFHEYFDLGRTHYFEDVLGENALTKKTHVIIVQVNTTYVKEIFFGDAIQLVSKVIRFGTKSFTMLQAILRESDNGMEICAFAVTTFVCINYTTQATHAIPKEWVEKITEFENQK